MEKEIIHTTNETEAVTPSTEKISPFNDPILGDLEVHGQIRSISESGVGAVDFEDEDSSAYLGFFNNTARIRLRGDGIGAQGPFEIQGTSDSLRLSVGAEGTLVNGTLEAKKEVTAPSFSGPLSGNATTATRLQTPRQINGINFDGSANITIPTGLAKRLQTPRTIALSGGVTGSTTFDGSANATISATVVPSSHTHTVAQVTNLQTELNNRALTNHTHPAQTTVTGNAGTATRLQTPRQINGINFDGSANITVPTSAHTHNASEINAGILNVERIPRGTAANQVATGNHTHTWDSLTNRPNIPTASTTAPLIAGVATIGTGATFARADHIHPTQTAVTGNAGTATRLQTPRQINGVNFDGSANITIPMGPAERLQTPRTIALSGGATGSVNFDGSANATINVTVPSTGHIHGFDQLRGIARNLPQATDLNTIFEGGFYRVENPMNAPTDASSWWYVQIIQQGPSEGLQIAWLADTPHQTWIRSAWKDRSWSTWARPDAARAERLTTPRTINGVNFDGSTNITLPPQISVTGNAGTATRLINARLINGTSFNGTEGITTARWGHARTVTLAGAVTGSASIDGSQHVTINTTLGNARMSNMDDLDISLDEFHAFIYEKLVDKAEISKYVEGKRAKESKEKTY